MLTRTTHGRTRIQCGGSNNLTITNLEFNSFVNPFGSWSTIEVIRDQHFSIRASLTHLYVEIGTNSNGVNGANFRNRTNAVNANLVLTVDQATGEFEDDTNRDELAAGDDHAVIYNQGDNTVILRNLGIVCSS